MPLTHRWPPEGAQERVAVVWNSAAWPPSSVARSRVDVASVLAPSALMPPRLHHPPTYLSPPTCQPDMPASPTWCPSPLLPLWIMMHTCPTWSMPILRAATRSNTSSTTCQAGQQGKDGGTVDAAPHCEAGLLPHKHSPSPSRACLDLARVVACRSGQHAFTSNWHAQVRNKGRGPT